MYRFCEWNDAARRVLQEIIWVHSVLEWKNRVIIFLVCICAQNVEQSSAGYEQETKSLWEDLEQLTSQTSIYCNLTANKLQLLCVKPSLMTECGVYLAYPFLRSPVFSPSHPPCPSACWSLFCYRVLFEVSSSPPPLLLLSWYNHLWPLTWPMTTRLSGWQCKPLWEEITLPHNSDNWPDTDTHSRRDEAGGILWESSRLLWELDLKLLYTHTETSRRTPPTVYLALMLCSQEKQTSNIGRWCNKAAVPLAEMRTLFSEVTLETWVIGSRRIKSQNLNQVKSNSPAATCKHIRISVTSITLCL